METHHREVGLLGGRAAADEREEVEKQRRTGKLVCREAGAPFLRRWVARGAELIREGHGFGTAVDIVRRESARDRAMIAGGSR